VTDLRSGDWFAGFADGEAHFEIAVQRSARLPAPAHQPRFEISLRADDRELLERLSDAFGGSVTDRIGHAINGAASAVYHQKPQVRWTVSKKADLLALADYFDLHPLHSKKAVDCAIWCAAVRDYAAGGYRAPRLALFAREIRLGRRYQEVPA